MKYNHFMYSKIALKKTAALALVAGLLTIPHLLSTGLQAAENSTDSNVSNVVKKTADRNPTAALANAIRATIKSADKKVKPEISYWKKVKLGDNFEETLETLEFERPEKAIEGPTVATICKGFKKCKESGYPAFEKLTLRAGKQKQDNKDPAKMVVREIEILFGYPRGGAGDFKSLLIPEIFNRLCKKHGIPHESKMFEVYLFDGSNKKGIEPLPPVKDAEEVFSRKYDSSFQMAKIKSGYRLPITSGSTKVVCSNTPEGYSSCELTGQFLWKNGPNTLAFGIRTDKRPYATLVFTTRRLEIKKDAIDAGIQGKKMLKAIENSF